MFHIGIPAACVLLQLYVTWRASSVPCITRRVPRRYLWAIAVVLVAICLVGRLVGHRSTGLAAAALELTGVCWLASLLLLSVSLLVIEIVTGFGLIIRRRAPTLRGWALLGGGAMSVIALVQGLRPPAVVAHEVHLAGLPAKLDGTVVVAIADLHLGNLVGASWLAARVEQIRQQRPDLVVLVGDIIEGHGKTDPAIVAQLQRLPARIGRFAVTGNHEHHHRHRGDDVAAKRVFESAGIEVLGDRWVEPRPGLIIAGVDDLTARRRSRTDGATYVERALDGRPAGATVLLSHTPWHADKAAKMGAALMVSGHTHGGQIWPLGWLVRLRYPLLGGRHRVGRMTVLVCRGTGTWGPRMRLWRRGEILRITLRSGRSDAAGASRR